MSRLPEASWRLRIYCSESDRQGRTPLHEAIVRSAHDDGLAGAIVFKGSMGFGAHQPIHSASLLRLSEDLPLLIEIIDTRDNLDPFITKLKAQNLPILATLDPVEVVLQNTTP